MLVSAPTEGGVPSLHPNLVRVLKLMMPHLHPEGVERFVTHVLRPSGESKGGCKQVWKWGERMGEGGWLEIVLGGWVGLGWSFPPAGWGLHVWTFAWHLRGSPQAFLPAYLDVCRAEAEEGLGGLKALQPNITNGLNSVLELTHAFRWNWTFLGRCTVPRVRCSQTSH